MVLRDSSFETQTENFVPNPKLIYLKTYGLKKVLSNIDIKHVYLLMYIYVLIRFIGK